MLLEPALEVPVLPEGRTRVLIRQEEVGKLKLCIVFIHSKTPFSCFILSIDDKRLGAVLKKMGLTDLKGIEEVNMIKDDGAVIQIKSPKSKF